MDAESKTCGCGGRGSVVLSFSDLGCLRRLERGSGFSAC